MLLVKRGLCVVVCIGLAGCFKLAPKEDDIIPFVTDLQPKEVLSAGKKVELTQHRCRLMAHGMSYDCKVSYRLTGGEGGAAGETPPTNIYLILREADGKWILVSHRDKP